MRLGGPGTDRAKLQYRRDEGYFWGHFCELRKDGQQRVGLALVGADVMENIDWANEGIGMTTRFRVAQEWTTECLTRTQVIMNLHLLS